MKLREFNFNSIMVRSLTIKEAGAITTDRERCFTGFIGETLRKIPLSWANSEIVDTRYYFDEFVIELAKEESNA